MMLSSVVVVGHLGEHIDPFYRYLEVEDENVMHDDLSISRIPIKYWTRMSKNVLMSMQKGKNLVIRGRIESDPKLGLYILVEDFNYI